MSPIFLFLFFIQPEENLVTPIFSLLARLSLLSTLQLARDLAIQTSGIDMETATVVSTAVDPIDLVPYPQQGSSFNFVQSSVRQSSDIRQDTEFARLVERVKSDYENKELESAKNRIAQSPISFRNTFDIQVQSYSEHLYMSTLQKEILIMNTSLAVVSEDTYSHVKF
ncbi:hypothetical protein NQZ79_g5761 [Umbelopsis isabellina]|nr:hypothetical protein NQZ79_g5761 [Umbelopsis isabellina]